MSDDDVPVFGYTLESLRALPTLCVGQADDLKFDEGGYRVWVARCGAADGLPYDNMVTIERRDPATGRWETIVEHEARPGEEHGLLAMVWKARRR